MIHVDDPALQKKIEQLFQHKQGHIFRFWEQIGEQNRKNLLNQVSGIDLKLLGHFIEKAGAASSSAPTDLKPPQIISLEERRERDQEALKIGEAHIRAGKMAAFLVAGGQGTRLGFDGPKGMYPVTPVEKKSLFQLHAEKLIAVSRRYNVTIPWYIMTSQTNNEQTQQFFQKNNFFGLTPTDVFFLVQEMVPAIDRAGRLILDAPDHLFMNPNGHGGSLKALWDEGAIADMRQRGIETIFYFQVDNVLTHICDPVYTGYHVQADSDMSNKVVRKISAEEKMGILCLVNNKLGLVEYSDLSEEDMYATDEHGDLKFWAGNIATHILEVSFVVQENEGGFHLPYHIAEKSIPYTNEQGKQVRPEGKNGLKFETFVFDALPDARNSVSVEVDRSREFSALKNKEGSNSPATVKTDLINTYGGWLEAAGHQLRKDANGNFLQEIEISPLFGLNADDLKKKDIRIDPQADHIYLE